MTIDEYYENLKQELLADSGNDFLANAFVEKMCNVIAEQGAIPDAEPVGYKFTQRGIAVDAFARDPERGRCVLLISDFRNSRNVESVANSEIGRSLKRLDRFIEACCKYDFVNGLEETDPVFPLARYVYEHHDSIYFDFILITDAQISNRVKEITPAEYDIRYAKHCEVWHLQRLFELDASGREREPLEVDLTKYNPRGIECLKALAGGTSCLQSFLFVLPGQILADLYEKYGERLLEQNVRTFLQFRGTINKGIRNTIVQQPGMFFSYNNGLSATAEGVTTNETCTCIKKILNLQIVNGGQTTASIYTAWKKEHVPLDDIFVQVKLTVVKGENVTETEIIQKISEFANTQNKVNAADFFSNHPFHLRIEEFSRRIWAPAADGSPRQTHWFYERARGQYANAMANQTRSEASRFMAQNPKEQMFKKTDLAKYYLTFKELPFIVSLGAQKAFSGVPGHKGFVSIITSEWASRLDREGNNISINEKWYKDIIAQAILFKGLDKKLLRPLRECGYGSFKAVIVSYTLSRFIHLIGQTQYCLDYAKIWQMQKVPDSLMEVLLEIANAIVKYFKASQTHVSELAKKENCWQEIQALQIKPDIVRIKPFLCYKDVVEEENRHALREQKDINNIHALQYIVEKTEDYWQKLRAWDDNKHVLSPKERGILDIACKITRTGRLPSDSQSKALIRAEKRAIVEGFYVK